MCHAVSAHPHAGSAHAMRAKTHQLRPIVHLVVGLACLLLLPFIYEGLGVPTLRPLFAQGQVSDSGFEFGFAPTISMTPSACCISNLLNVDFDLVVMDSPQGPLDTLTGQRTNPTAVHAYATAAPTIKLQFGAIEYVEQLTFQPNLRRPEVGSWRMRFNATTSVQLVDALTQRVGGRIHTALSLDGGINYIMQSAVLEAIDCGFVGWNVIRPKTARTIRAAGGNRIELRMIGKAAASTFLSSGTSSGGPAGSLRLRVSTSSVANSISGITSSVEVLDLPVVLILVNTFQSMTTPEMARLRVSSPSGPLYLHISFDSGASYQSTHTTIEWSTAPSADRPLKIGFGYISSINDAGWSYAANLGRLSVATTFAASIQTSYVENIPRPAGKTEVTGKFIAEYLSKNTDLDMFLTTGSTQLAAVHGICAQFPGITFAVSVDAAELLSVTKNSSYSRANVPVGCTVAVFWAELYTARYLAGIVAGAVAKARNVTQIGFLAAFITVNNTDTATQLTQRPRIDAQVVAGMNAFLLGAQKMYPEVELVTTALGGFTAPFNESLGARYLLDQGVGLLAHHTNSKDAMLALLDYPDRVGIGSNSDQMRLLVGERVLTAPFFNWAGPMSGCVQAMLDGELEPGFFLDGGISEGFVDIVAWLAKGITALPNFYPVLPDVTPNTLPYPLVVVLFLLATLVGLFGLFSAGVSLVYRSTPLMKASSWLFCSIIGLASAANVSSTFLFGMDTQFLSVGSLTDVCQLLPWWLLLSFNLQFGSLIVKLWRIDRIWGGGDKSFKKQQLQDWKLLLLLAALAVPICCILAAWQHTAPLSWQSIVASADSYANPTSTLSQCTSNHASTYTGILFGYVVMLLMLSLVYSYRTRTLPAAFSEAKWIFLCILNLAQVMIVLVPLNFLLDANQGQGTALFTIRSAGVILLNSILLALFFGPKLVQLRADQASGVVIATSNSALGNTTAPGPTAYILADAGPNSNAAVRTSSHDRQLVRHSSDAASKQVQERPTPTGARAGTSGVHSPVLGRTASDSSVPSSSGPGPIHIGAVVAATVTPSSPSGTGPTVAAAWNTNDVGSGSPKG